MDAIDLNNSPDLSMEEITKFLFNNKFLSDVEFHVEGKVIYAHAWELMKRSIVFRNLFIGNLGENKLIPIEDTTYEVFYEFVRFIYTDECKIESTTISELLKLAVRYKIVKLQTKILNHDDSWETVKNLFEFCVLNAYDLAFNGYLYKVWKRIDDNVNFSTISKHPKVLEEILKADRIESSITEVKLFDGLTSWMNQLCEEENIPIAMRTPVCKSHFDHLIRLIRFPTISADEFLNCVKNHADLLSSEDISTVFMQMANSSKIEKPRWISKPRISSKGIREEKEPDLKKLTKFTVTRSLGLCGLRYGKWPGTFKVKISSKNLTTNAIDSLSFKFEKVDNTFYTICLGESLKLKPNFEYTIETHVDHKTCMIRNTDEKLIVTGPSDAVKFTEISEMLFEIFFKLPN